jgi:cytochrome c2
MRRLIMLLFATTLCGCQQDTHFDVAKALIAERCSVCHVVPGVNGANGMIGPSLAGIAKQEIIAGHFPNTPEDMTRWILHPQLMLPGNAMADTGLSPAQAQQIVRYLYTLDKR